MLLTTGEQTAERFNVERKSDWSRAPDVVQPIFRSAVQQHPRCRHRYRDVTNRHKNTGGYLNALKTHLMIIYKNTDSTALEDIYSEIHKESNNEIFCKTEKNIDKDKYVKRIAILITIKKSK